MAGFREQKQADLRDVRAGGDMDEVFLALEMEFVAAGKVRKRPIDLLEIPGI